MSAESAFGNEVRLARMSISWTQDQMRRRLAESHGIDLSKTAMSRLEQGERPIRLNEVYALAQLLGIDLSTLKVDVVQLGDRIAQEIRFAEEQLQQAEAEVDRRRARLAELRGER